MGEVSNPIGVGRTAPSTPVAAAPIPSEPAQTDAASREMEPRDTASAQVVTHDAPVFPSTIQPQSQTLALLQTQALPEAAPQNMTRAALMPPLAASTAGRFKKTMGKTAGEISAKAMATRQLQLVRQLYAGADEPSPLISIVG